MVDALMESQITSLTLAGMNNPPSGDSEIGNPSATNASGVCVSGISMLRCKLVVENRAANQASGRVQCAACVKAHVHAAERKRFERNNPPIDLPSPNSATAECVWPCLLARVMETNKIG